MQKLTSVDIIIVMVMVLVIFSLNINGGTLPKIVQN